MTAETVAMTRILADFIASFDRQKIPETAYRHAKVAFIDWLAVTYGGKDDPLVEKLITVARLMGGNVQATLIGREMKTDVSHATLVNGACSHALDYDDTMVSFFGHPSVTLFPSLLALSEWKALGGEELLTAYLIGLQAGGTIGRCAGLEHYMAGWHATSTLGHLASAAACSRLLGLDEKQTVHALGIAGTQSSGLKRVFGTMCKPFHAGRASQSGLIAALLASDGFTSAEDILEGPHGFFAILKGKVEPQFLELLGLGWDVETISQKYHASCHATHSPLEAAVKIVKENQIAIPDIARITVYSSQMALDASGKPAPETGSEGKFSIPYCVANAIITGETGNQAFTDGKVQDPKTRELMDRITVELDSSKTALEATVQVKTKAGNSFEVDSDILQQIPPLEIKQDRIRKKFMDLAGPFVGGRKADELIRMIEELQDFKSMKELISHL